MNASSIRFLLISVCIVSAFLFDRNAIVVCVSRSLILLGLLVLEHSAFFWVQVGTSLFFSMPRQVMQLNFVIFLAWLILLFIRTSGHSLRLLLVLPHLCPTPVDLLPLQKMALLSFGKLIYKHFAKPCLYLGLLILVIWLSKSSVVSNEFLIYA